MKFFLDELFIVFTAAECLFSITVGNATVVGLEETNEELLIRTLPT